MQHLSCDFFVFRGRRLYVPNGIDMLYGRRELVDEMIPWQAGGDMIEAVSFERTTFAAPPNRFEAVTRNVVGSDALAAAIKYLVKVVGMRQMHEYETALGQYALQKLREVVGIRLLGHGDGDGHSAHPTGSGDTSQFPLGESAPIFAFVSPYAHRHELDSLLDRDRIATRGGHHCAKPLAKAYCIKVSTCISLAFYNTQQEVDTVIASLKRVVGQVMSGKDAIAAATVIVTKSAPAAPYGTGASALTTQHLPAADPATTAASLASIYQEILIDRGTRPHNHRELHLTADEEKEVAIARAPNTQPAVVLLKGQGYNSLCGDNISLYLKLRLRPAAAGSTDAAAHCPPD
jgi:hypothetical protein